MSSPSPNAETAAAAAPKKKEGLLSVNLEHKEPGHHTLKFSVNLGNLKKSNNQEDHPNWKKMEDAFAMHNNMKAAEEAMEVDDETAKANLAKRESTIQRLLRHDPELVRIDVCASLYAEIPDFDEFLYALETNETIEVVHLSGLGTRDAVHPDDFIATVEAIGCMPNLKELFVFRGTSKVLNEELLAKCLTMAKKLKVLMIWGYDDSLSQNQILAG